MACYTLTNFIKTLYGLFPKQISIFTFPSMKIEIEWTYGKLLAHSFAQHIYCKREREQKENFEAILLIIIVIWGPICNEK